MGYSLSYHQYRPQLNPPAPVGEGLVPSRDFLTQIHAIDRRSRTQAGATYREDQLSFCAGIHPRENEVKNSLSTAIVTGAHGVYS